MLTTNITEEEIEFMELFYYTPALIECLFNDFDNLADFSENEFGEVRLGQLPLLSYEYILDENPEMRDKENFRLKEGAGTIYCFGGRNFGKTLCIETLDIPISMLLLDAQPVGFTSLDAMHIRGVLEKVIVGLQRHPILKLLDSDIKRSPNYNITIRNGYNLESVNMNLQGAKPGAGFFQKHFKRLYIEEQSFETDDIYKKRQDSVDEDGCVIRGAGMTNFTKYSPTGKIFYDSTKRGVVVNLPQYINPKYDAKKHEQAKKEHGGESSLSFKIYVEGEVTEEGISVFDMKRVKKCYNEEKVIKFFEIKKENFINFHNIIILEKIKQADKIYLCADIGETAPTEIIIIFEINSKYYYSYNITAYGLTDKEQFKLFTWLATQLDTTFISLDCSEGTGRAIFRSLGEILPKERLVWVSFNEKIRVDFEKDENGNVMFDDTGLPKYKEEFVSEWAVKRLKDILYQENKIEIPLDYKFDSQFNSVIALQSGNRVVYDCVEENGDHLFSAFKVFAIAEWYNEFNNIKPLITKVFCKSGV